MTARVLITHVTAMELPFRRGTRYDIAGVQADDVTQRAHFYTFDDLVAEACRDAITHNRTLAIDFRDQPYGNLIERLRVQP